jgi:hypothetical protein
MYRQVALEMGGEPGLTIVTVQADKDDIKMDL